MLTSVQKNLTWKRFGPKMFYIFFSRVSSSSFMSHSILSDKIIWEVFFHLSQCLNLFTFLPISWLTAALWFFFMLSISSRTDIACAVPFHTADTSIWWKVWKLGRNEVDQPHHRDQGLDEAFLRFPDVCSQGSVTQRCDIMTSGSFSTNDSYGFSGGQ